MSISSFAAMLTGSCIFILCSVAATCIAWSDGALASGEPRDCTNVWIGIWLGIWLQVVQLFATYHSGQQNTVHKKKRGREKKENKNKQIER